MLRNLQLVYEKNLIEPELSSYTFIKKCVHMHVHIF
jgi:hypothetical protein